MEKKDAKEKNTSHRANVKNAAKAGYAKIGNATLKRNRITSNRTRAVSTIATMKHTSHAGKNEPSTSRDGAREQLDSSGATSRSGRRLTKRESRRSVMVWVSFRSIDLSPPL